MNLEGWREAFEEVGIIGDLHGMSVGTFTDGQKIFWVFGWLGGYDKLSMAVGCSRTVRPARRKIEDEIQTGLEADGMFEVHLTAIKQMCTLIIQPVA
ncbi:MULTISPECIES: hypothetical protein [Rhizobium]|uniref:hypothetical protein n=1 Tax=Rhizobium TaxID=379 RepID=UPI0007E5A25B|nr:MULTISPECIES: hypothetical protein [Rhizobium]